VIAAGILVELRRAAEFPITTSSVSANVPRVLISSMSAETPRSNSGSFLSRFSKIFEWWSQPP